MLVLEAGSPKFNDRNIKMPIAILRYPTVTCINISLPVWLVAGCFMVP